MTDPILRLNAALEGRYRVEREIGQGGMATVDTTAGFSVDPPRLLFAGSYPRQTNYANYDVAPDGERVVVPGPLIELEDATVVLVQDWFTELCERTGDC